MKNSIFDRFYKKYDYWYEKNKFAYLSELKAIRQVLPKKGKSLEIGVGTGRFSAPLGVEFGIDPSKEMLKIARQRGVNAKLGIGEKLSYANAIFDYILIVSALCFAKDPCRMIKEAGRVLKHRKLRLSHGREGHHAEIIRPHPHAFKGGEITCPERMHGQIPSKTP